jgi:hypothetical protein
MDTNGREQKTLNRRCTQIYVDLAPGFGHDAKRQKPFRHTRKHFWLWVVFIRVNLRSSAV